MKFLHCADLHLGCPDGEERMRAFDRMIRFCKTDQIDVLLVAGDLFDAPRVNQRTRQRVFDALAENASLCVMIAAGNHDPLCAGGNYDGTLPDNVYVFGREWSCAEIPAYGVRVWGASFVHTHEGSFAPKEKKRRLTQGLHDLGVLHADLLSAGAHSDYRAISSERIAQTGLEYLALGHIHVRSEVRRAGKTLYAYSGCLQGQGFEDIGEKGAYMGELGENGLEMSFVRFSGSMTLEETLDVTGCSSVIEVAARYDQRIGRRKGHRVLLTLTGTPRGFAVDADALERLIAGSADAIRIEDETRPDVDYTAVAQEKTLRGAFVRRMLDKIEQKGQEADTARQALRLGLEAFDGEVRQHVD